MADAESKDGGCSPRPFSSPTDQEHMELFRTSHWLAQQRLWNHPRQIRKCLTHMHAYTETHVCMTHMHTTFVNNAIYQVLLKRASQKSQKGAPSRGICLEGTESKKHAAR